MMFDPPMSKNSFRASMATASMAAIGVMMALLLFWLASTERAVRTHNDQQWSALAALATTEDQRLLVQYFKSKCATPSNSAFSPSSADEVRARCISAHAAELGVRAIPKPALRDDLRALGVMPSP